MIVKYKLFEIVLWFEIRDLKLYNDSLDVATRTSREFNAAPGYVRVMGPKPETAARRDGCGAAGWTGHRAHTGAGTVSVFVIMKEGSQHLEAPTAPRHRSSQG